MTSDFPPTLNTNELFSHKHDFIDPLSLQPKTCFVSFVTVQQSTACQAVIQTELKNSHCADNTPREIVIITSLLTRSSYYISPNRKFNRHDRITHFSFYREQKKQRTGPIFWDFWKTHVQYLLKYILFSIINYTGRKISS